MIRLPGLALVALLIATPVSAMTERLSGSEINDWISGNTVVGEWAGISYRQFFRTDGTTAYKAAGVPNDEGRWWVTETEYCSWWRSSGEDCYEVHREDGKLIWRTTGLFSRSYDADVVPGDRLQGQ